MEEGLEKAGESRQKRTCPGTGGVQEGQLAESELGFGEQEDSAVGKVWLGQAVISIQNDTLPCLAEVTSSRGLSPPFQGPSPHVLGLVSSACRPACFQKERQCLQSWWT